MKLYRFFVVFLFALSAFASDQPKSLELSRPVRPWEFMGSFGQRAGVFGTEDGNFEAWVYPMKLLRNFHLTFHVQGRAIPAAAVARTLIVHPESTTIVYAYEQFQVRETICVPVHEMGAMVRLETSTYFPMQIEAAYTNDLQLMWPAAVGNVWPGFDDKLNALTISGNDYFGIIGAKGLIRSSEPYNTDYGDSNTTSFLLPEVPKGSTTQVIAIAGSIKGHDDAAAEYQKLLTNAAQLEADSAQYYRDYLARTVSVEFPQDRKLQEAYDWARVSTIQGLVENPYLGTGLVAGYRTSGYSARPGYAWFFGRDSEWTDLALDSIGDFATVKTALEFLIRVQRENGRIPHEISQTATLTDWWNKYPYGTASVDATPLFLIAANDYVVQSGDVKFAQDNWPYFIKAYYFLKSTYDAEGFPQNAGFGHGWVEGGPLVPIHSELYESALAVEAERSFGHLAQVARVVDITLPTGVTDADRLKTIERKFWLPAKNSYAFGIGTDGKMNETASVEATVPMWFGLLDPTHANLMIDQLASSHHSTDWGMRIISDQEPIYSPEGYHYGAVWPLFTGWAAVGEYKYHRALAAYQNMRENAMLTLDGSLGHDTEVLSGAYYQQHSIASPHQIWSAAMVLSPVLRGMMGLAYDSTTQTLTFAPHVPPDLAAYLRHISFNHGLLDLSFSRGKSLTEAISITATPSGNNSGTLIVSPSISPSAHVMSVTINERKAPFKITKTPNDQHVEVVAAISGETKIVINVKDDLVLGIPAELPALGFSSQNIKPISERWGADRAEFVFEGIAGRSYDLPCFSDLCSNIDGVEGSEGPKFVHITFPPGTGYVRKTVIGEFK